MRVLVTGGNGFVGSWISKYFAELGYEVTSLVRVDSDISRLTGSTKINVVRLESKDWDNYVESFLPETLILADWAGVSGSEAQSELQMRNVARWKNLANSAHKVGVTKVLAFGSQAEVGLKLLNVTEDSICEPQTIYGKAKLEAFQTLTNIFRGSNTSFVWGRVFTVYGPDDNSNWLIPSVIAALDLDKPFETTEGLQYWNYLYIHDLCSAVETLISKSDFSGVVNIASPDSIQIHALLNVIERQMQKRGLIKYGAKPYSVNQIMNVTPNVSKLLKLGWSPKFDVETGIQRTIKSFLSKSSDID